MPDKINSLEQLRSWYLGAFEDFEKSLNGQSSDAFHARRKTAIQHFVTTGFPTTKNEDWKYTDLASVASTQFLPVVKPGHIPAGRIDPYLVEGQNILVFVDGYYTPALSKRLPHGNQVLVENLSASMHERDFPSEKYLAQYASVEKNSFAALSTAFLRDGALISVPDNTVVEDPLQIIFCSSERAEPYIVHPRILVVAGKNSQFRLIETHIGCGEGVYFSNAIAEIVLGENSILEHERVQDETHRASHISTTYVHQSRASGYTSHNFTLGGSLTRNDIVVELDGEGGEATLNGLYLGTGNRHVDNHTVIDHVRPHCSSHELYKGILAGRSRGVFNGKIVVRKDAQKTDAKQTNKNLILSDEASIDTKPQLEIFANDVKCTHGATVGQLDDEAMFYLRSRGIPVDESKNILVYAFASDLLDRISDEPIRDKIREVLTRKLDSARK